MSDTIGTPEKAADEDAAGWWVGKRDEVYLALLEGATLRKVAEQVGVQLRTLYGWRHRGSSVLCAEAKPGRSLVFFVPRLCLRVNP